MTAEDIDQGARRAVRAALAGLPRDWLVLHDVPCPQGSGGRLDHVVLGRTGVYVVRAPGWEGSVSFRRGAVLLDGAPRTDEVAGVAGQAEVVRALVPEFVAKHVEPVLCVTGQDVRGRVEDVHVTSAAFLPALIVSAREVFTPAELVLLRYGAEFSIDRLQHRMAAT